MLRDGARAHAHVLRAHGRHSRCTLGSNAQCHGEISVTGIERLLALLPPPCKLDVSSTVYDLGSGRGLFAAFVRLRASVRAVVGI